jgi:hypothetical protein
MGGHGGDGMNLVVWVRVVPVRQEGEVGKVMFANVTTVYAYVFYVCTLSVIKS